MESFQKVSGNLPEMFRPFATLALYLSLNLSVFSPSLSLPLCHMSVRERVVWCWAPPDSPLHVLCDDLQTAPAKGSSHLHLQLHCFASPLPPSPSSPSPLHCSSLFPLLSIPLPLTLLSLYLSPVSLLSLLVWCPTPVSVSLPHQSPASTLLSPLSLFISSVFFISLLHCPSSPPLFSSLLLSHSPFLPSSLLLSSSPLLFS